MHILSIVIFVALPFFCFSDEEATTTEQPKSEEQKKMEIFEKCKKDIGTTDMTSGDEKSVCLRNCVLRKLNAIDKDGKLNKEGMGNYIESLKTSGIWVKSGMNRMFRVDFEQFYKKCQGIKLEGGGER
ncbi:Obp19d family protein [Megaselia abdita]